MCRWLRALPVVAYMAVLFVLSSRSAVPTPVEAVDDKLLHVVGYAPLGALIAWAVAPRARAPGRRVAAWGALLGAVYGVTDEVHQVFVPGRFPSVGDVVADAIGAAFGAVVMVFWQRRRRAAANASGAGRATE